LWFVWTIWAFLPFVWKGILDPLFRSFSEYLRIFVLATGRKVMFGNREPKVLVLEISVVNCFKNEKFEVHLAPLGRILAIYSTKNKGDNF
jgi:hypothetical protein